MKWSGNGVIVHVKRVEMALARTRKVWARWRGSIWERTSGSESDNKWRRLVFSSSKLARVLFVGSITESGTADVSIPTIVSVAEIFDGRIVLFDMERKASIC